MSQKSDKILEQALKHEGIQTATILEKTTATAEGIIENSGTGKRIRLYSCSVALENTAATAEGVGFRIEFGTVIWKHMVASTSVAGAFFDFSRKPITFAVDLDFQLVPTAGFTGEMTVMCTFELVD